MNLLIILCCQVFTLTVNCETLKPNIYSVVYLLHNLFGGDKFEAASVECRARYINGGLATFQSKSSKSDLLRFLSSIENPHSQFLVAARQVGALYWWIGGHEPIAQIDFLSLNISNATRNERSQKCIFVSLSQSERELKWKVADCSSAQAYICELDQDFFRQQAAQRPEIEGSTSQGSEKDEIVNTGSSSAGSRILEKTTSAEHTSAEPTTSKTSTSLRPVPEKTILKLPSSKTPTAKPLTVKPPTLKTRSVKSPTSKPSIAKEPPTSKPPTPKPTTKTRHTTKPPTTQKPIIIILPPTRNPERPPRPSSAARKRPTKRTTTKRSPKPATRATRTPSRSFDHSPRTNNNFDSRNKTTTAKRDLTVTLAKVLGATVAVLIALKLLVSFVILPMIETYDDEDSVSDSESSSNKDSSNESNQEESGGEKESDD